MGLFAKKYIPPRTEGMDVDTLYARGRSAEDPRDAHTFLSRAAEIAPDDLRIQKELLLRGDLHKRDAQNISFHVIKCYLLHTFEHPEDHDENEQKRMARELFDHEQLLRCLEIAPDRETFLKEYLQDLCAEYVRLFIAGDTTHTRAILGITMAARQPVYLAVPAYDVIHNILAYPAYTEEEKTLLAGAFYRAYHAFMDGRTAPLDEKLGNDLGRLIR